MYSGLESARVFANLNGKWPAVIDDNPKGQVVQTLSYMTQFECLGSACSDNCCHHWAVGIDGQKYARLQERISQDGKSAAKYAHAFKMVHDEKMGPSGGAIIQEREDGRCFFLEDDGLCHIHGKYGQEYLADTCQSYPRRWRQVNERLELSGLPSCPEVMRLLLSSKESVRAASSHVSALGHEPHLMNSVILDEATVYHQANHELRFYFATLIRESALPIRDELLAVSLFARLTHEQVHPNMSASDFKSVGERLKAYQNDAYRQSVLARLQQIELPPAKMSSRLIFDIIPCAAQVGSATRLRELLRSILIHHGGVAQVEVDAANNEELLGLWEGHASQIDTAYHDRVAGSSRSAFEGLSLAYRNMAINYFMTTWVVKYPSFSEYFSYLALQLACSRVLYFLSQEPGGDSQNTLVDSFYAFARVASHHDEFHRVVLGWMGNLELPAWVIQKHLLDV